MRDDSTTPRFYAVRHEDDIPTPGKGMLIPRKRKKAPAAKVALQKIDHYAALALIPLSVMVFILSAGMFGVQSVASVASAPAPKVAVSSGEENQLKPLNYGVQIALAQPVFFKETRDAFIEAETTFIEVDLTQMQLRYFEAGVLTDSMEILAKGKRGTFWETPAGLYQVEDTKERYYSNLGQMYQPWTILFQGNFFIHGWPEYVDGTPVPNENPIGGIRVETDAAKRLFSQVKTNTPVLVHEVSFTEDQFVYEPKIPELKTPHYLIADVESSTVLASSDLSTVAPIASVAKLMTALVAAEYINLDSSVYVNEPTFVQSLVPRLGDRSRVSMYSLLQLLLVESSNEAAEVIAAQLGHDEFVAKMNEKALTLGMVDSHFADPSGLSAENTSSLSDLLRLAQYIYTNRSFILELTANQDIKTGYTGGEFGELVNFNKVEDLENFIGGKVGETIAAGQTSLTLHTIEVKGAKRVVAIIILGSENRNEDVRELLRYAEERFSS